MFWVIAFLLVAGTVVILVLPLIFTQNDGDIGALEQEVALYHAQIEELQRDIERNTLDPDEAEARRAEISRRLIATKRRGPSPTTAARAKPAPWVAVGLAGGILIGAVALYRDLGAPGYPDMPLSLRYSQADTNRETRPSQSDYIALLEPAAVAEPDEEYLQTVEMLRTVVAKNPEDIKGLSYLVRHEAALQNYEAAIKAQKTIIELKGRDASVEDLRMVLDLFVYQAQGYVSPEAELLAREILAMDPGDTGARYYLGAMYDQTGRPDIAFSLWREIAETAAEGDPYRALSLRFLPRAAHWAGVEYDPPEQTSLPQDVPQMVEGMVEDLATRLASEGGAPEDWGRLIRSLRVLGQDTRAEAIADEARTLFAADPEALRALDEAQQ